MPGPTWLGGCGHLRLTGCVLLLLEVSLLMVGSVYVVLHVYHIILIMDSSNEHNEAVHRGPDGRAFYGAVTVGERGQVVIPAQARRDHGIEPGQKLLVLGSPDGIALMSVDKVMKVLDASADLRSVIGEEGADAPASE